MYLFVFQDRQSTSVKMDPTDNEPQLIRKLTIPEIAWNVYLFSKK